MNKISNVFQKRPAFIGYIMGGDGGVDYTIDCALQLIAGGVDILEIGFPFSDPVADGPVIQRAAMRALEAKTTSHTLLDIAKGIRKQSDVPLILFSYCNPLHRRGEKYLKEVKATGYDAVLIVDLPPIISSGRIDPFFKTLKETELTPIFLVAPSTDPNRLFQISQVAEGFIYYACQKGTTGERLSLPGHFAHDIARIRQVTSLPIAAGFGIAERSTAHAALLKADGFVTGSAFVAMIEKRVDPIELKLRAQSMDPRTLGDLHASY